MSKTSPPRRRSSRLFAIIVAILIIAIAVEVSIIARGGALGPGALRLLRPGAARRPEAAQQAIAQAGAVKIETIGDPNSPLKLKFYAPLTLDWHQKTIGLLREYNEQHPGRIHVTLMPMGLKECDEEMNYSCAVIYINEENEFTLPDGRQLTLEKRPNEPYSTYNSEDVLTILDQLAEEP